MDTFPDVHSGSCFAGTDRHCIKMPPDSDHPLGGSLFHDGKPDFSEPKSHDGNELVAVSGSRDPILAVLPVLFGSATFHLPQLLNHPDEDF